jgi:putative membrane protein
MRTSFVLGVSTLLASWIGLISFEHPPFFLHMTVHMAVVALASPLLAISISRSQWNPVDRTPALSSPLLASFVELGVVWAWHTPALHHLARNNIGTLALEQLSFLLSGLFLWMAAIGGNLDARRGPGIVALLLTAMHMTLLGAILALAPRPLYDLHDAHGLSALEDQHLGGAIMILTGGIAYLAGGLWLSWGFLRYRRL